MTSRRTMLCFIAMKLGASSLVYAVGVQSCSQYLRWCKQHCIVVVLGREKMGRKWRKVNLHVSWSKWQNQPICLALNKQRYVGSCMMLVGHFSHALGGKGHVVGHMMMDKHVSNVLANDCYQVGTISKGLRKKAMSHSKHCLYYFVCSFTCTIYFFFF